MIGVEKEFDIREIDVERAYLQSLISPRPDGKAITLRQTEGTRMFVEAASLQPSTETLATATHTVDVPRVHFRCDLPQGDVLSHTLKWAIIHVAYYRLQPWVMRTVLGQVQVVSNATLVDIVKL